MNQKEGVYKAVTTAFEKRNSKWREGGDIRQVIKKDPLIREEIRELVFEGLKSGAIHLSDQRETSKLRKENDIAMRGYANSLISNWFRKDPRLNGGKRYVPFMMKSYAGINLASLPDREQKLIKLKEALQVASTQELKEELQFAIEALKNGTDVTSRDSLSGQA